MEWVVPERLEENQPVKGGNLTLPIVVSLLLHGLLLALLLIFGLTGLKPSSTEPQLVRINLIPVETVQVVEPVPESDLEQVSQVEASAESLPPVEDPVPPPQSLPVPSVAEVSEDLPEVELPKVEVESTPSEEQPAQTEPVLPSRVVLQQLVRSMSEQESLGIRQTDCSLLQQQNELIDCGSQDETPAWLNEARLENRYFSVGQVQNNNAQVQGVIKENSEQLIIQLEGLSGDSEMRAFVISELEAGIGVHATRGNIKLQRLQDLQNARDPAYQQMKRVMGPTVSPR